MKIAIIYASTTGNTEAMANAILEGATGAGADATLLRAGDVSASDTDSYDLLILGSPSMGAEILEEEEMEPFFTALESNLSGKKIALFGSYDWGDGQWMRDWEDRVRAAGGDLVKDGLTVNLTPEGESL
ncbi:MAG: flavodoxin, partial [Spirochaetales bacterium]